MFTSFQNKVRENQQIVIIIVGIIIFSGILLFLFSFSGNSMNKETRFTDTASGQVVSELNNESEITDINQDSPVTFIGFTNLYDILGAEGYDSFKNSCNKFIKESNLSESVKYVSLKKGSIEKSGKVIRFIIVLENDSTQSYLVEFSNNNFSFSKN